MKELCVDARMLLASGIGTYLRNLLPLIEQGPFKMRLVIDEAAAKQLPWLTRFDLIITSLPIYSIEEQIKLPLLIPKCDIFWSPHYNIPILPAACRRRLVTVHDANHLALSKNLTFSQRLYAKIVMKSAVLRSNKIITVSQFSKKELCKRLKVRPEKIEVILPGVDRKIYQPLEDGFSGQVRKQYRLPEKYFLFVGNVKPHKNLLGLLKGFLQITDTVDDVHIVVVGKRKEFLHNDHESETFANHPKLLGKVHFLGFVDDERLPSLYRMAMAVIIPSFYEGFGLPAIEAMSSACAVAASKAASLPEVCSDAAVYFDPHRPEEIGQVLKQLAVRNELVKELKEKGLKRSKEFCWEKCALGHIEVLESLHR
jgi:glycosyltransferase involved in cell wall biosynthesis